MPKRTSTNAELLTMALAGAEAEIGRIDAAIAELRAKMGKRGPGRPKGATSRPAHKRRTMSAAARRRIAAAQRKRWAEAKRAKATATKKRKLSAAARHKMAVAARKRRAERKKVAAKKAKPAVRGTKKPATAAAS